DARAAATAEDHEDHDGGALPAADVLAAGGADALLRGELDAGDLRVEVHPQARGEDGAAQAPSAAAPHRSGGPSRRRQGPGHPETRVLRPPAGDGGGEAKGARAAAEGPAEG